jgi:hypothetical protein
MVLLLSFAPAQLHLEERVARFELWMSRNGVDLKASGLQVLASAGRGLGVYATTPVSAGERLLTIPLPLIISTETAKQTSLG